MEKLGETFIYSVVKGIGKSLGAILVLRLFINEINIRNDKVSNVDTEEIEKIENNNDKTYKIKNLFNNF